MPPMMMRPAVLRAAGLMLRKLKATRKMPFKVMKVKKKPEEKRKIGPLRKKYVADGGVTLHMDITRGRQREVYFTRTLFGSSLGAFHQS
jgi:hypothetical protein